MDVYECMRTRRTVWECKPDPVPEAIVQQMLHAGRWAPSSRNTQPWSLAGAFLSGAFRYDSHTPVWNGWRCGGKGARLSLCEDDTEEERPWESTGCIRAAMARAISRR